MKLYLSGTHSDEEGSNAREGKLGMIYSSKKDIIKLCDFFAEVRIEVEKYENFHMHFRESFDDWDKRKHIDIEVNLANE